MRIKVSASAPFCCPKKNKLRDEQGTLIKKDEKEERRRREEEEKNLKEFQARMEENVFFPHQDKVAISF